MKTSKILAAIAALSVAAMCAPQVKAGPAPYSYVPVKTVHDWDALKVGTPIAFECEKCGRVTLMKYTKEMRANHAITCPYCHDEFKVKTVGSSGKTHQAGAIEMVCSDGEHARLMAHE